MNERRRATFASLAELLVPAVDGMPSAREAGAANAGLDRVLAARPELQAPLVQLLDRATGPDPAVALADLQREQAAFELLAFAVAGGYLTEPVVMGRLGYPGRPETPMTDDIDDEVVSLLEPVLDRGAVYRDPASGARPPAL